MRNERPPDSAARGPLDALIDEAARQMTDGEPPASLKGAVRERIGRQRSVWALVPALAAAAALVVAVLVGRALLDAPDNRQGVRPMTERAGINAPPVQAASDAQVSPPDDRRTGLQTDWIRAEGTTDSSAEVLPPVEDEPIPPIAIEPLTVTQIAGDVSSGLMPIEVEPLQVEPLPRVE